MTKEITIIEQEISPFVTQAKTIKIESANDMTNATLVLSQLNTFIDRIIEEKEKVTKPLNQALKAERLRWKPLEELYETAVASLRNKISKYQTEQIKIQKEQEAKIAARIAPGKGNLSLETAVKKIDALEKPVGEVETDVGTIRFREVSRLKIIDALLIPDEYWVIDEKVLLDALKTGRSVAGAEIEVVQVPVNYR